MVTERTFGKITVQGTAAECQLSYDAFHEGTPAFPLPMPVEDLGEPLRIEYHTAQEFLDHKPPLTVPGTKSTRWPKGRPAWGFRVGDRLLWINSGVARLRPAKIKHVNRHERGHDVDGDYLAPGVGKRASIMAECLVDEDGQHPTKWNVPRVYEDSCEGYADGFAIAISGIPSPFDYDVELVPGKAARLLQITFAAAPIDPNPEPIPPIEPLPIPDPCAGKVEELEKRIAAKDAAMAAGLQA